VPTGRASPQTPPENKECMIAIQGGGIFALPMLGQARAILSAGYIPLGFAGSSGGAILATLLWAGLSPDRIEQEFKNILQANPDGFSEFLLPLGTAPLSLPQLRASGEMIESLFPLPESTYRLILHLIRRRRDISSLVPPFRDAWARRGFFAGDRFKAFIERLVREGLKIPLERPQPVIFADVNAGDNRRGPRRPPLLLTATNVSRGKLELIDSTDPVYANMSIADAVRASAGFPLFFEPTDISGAGNGRCFVDGGMIANFPLWAFSRAFREKLQRRTDYGWLAARPWLPIGIRVSDAEENRDVSRPMDYVSRLFAVAFGMARNDMEERLVAATHAHCLIINQETHSLPLNPKTGKPLQVLDVDAVTAENLGNLTKTGDEAANKALQARGNYVIYNPACAPDVLKQLKDLVERCERAMQMSVPDQFHMRSNIFIAVREKLQMRFSLRMEGAIDDGLEFKDLSTGVTGWCYQTRSPALCNLAHVASVAKAASTRAASSVAQPDLPYKVEPDKIESSLSWLISYPIFDPAERQPLTGRLPPPDVAAPGLLALQGQDVGPILGVVNVDAAWDYAALKLDPNPEIHVSDPRIIAVIDTVAQASLRLARALVAHREKDYTA
jgi:predicted acylesterase/phospholipase RssA